MTNNLFSTTIRAGAIVGTLDSIAALVYYLISTGKNPLIIFKFIASGIFGKEAFSGGNTMILSGLVLHYIIAYLFTVFFFWLFPQIKAFSKSKVWAGIIYGIFIWLLMNLVIVPLSNISKQPFHPLSALINILILIVCIGIPLSFMANTFYRKVSLNKSAGIF